MNNIKSLQLSGCRIINRSISWLDTRTAGWRHYPVVGGLNPWVLEPFDHCYPAWIWDKISELDEPIRRPEDGGIIHCTGTKRLCLCERTASVFVQRPMDGISYARRHEAGLSTLKPATDGLWIRLGRCGRPSGGEGGDLRTEMQPTFGRGCRRPLVERFEVDGGFWVGGRKMELLTASIGRDARRISPWRLGRHNAAEIWRLLWNYCPSVGIQSVHECECAAEALGIVAWGFVQVWGLGDLSGIL